MELAQPWVLVATVIGALTLIAVGLWWGYRVAEKRSAQPALIARAERVRTHASVRAAVRRRRGVLVAAISLGAVAMIAAGVVAARPTQTQTIEPETRNRDIMLCLDVSGSMTDIDAEVLDVFVDMLPSLEGERIGLTIFNSTPVQVFPLTDDYDFIAEHLRSMRESFEYGDVVPEHWVGTLNGAGSSLIGDGLAACAMGFDNPEQERSRSLILATDNEVSGQETITLPAATSYARSLGVLVFVLDPIFDPNIADSAELTEVARASGGVSYGLRESTTVAEIVADIQRQEASVFRGEPEIVVVDSPGVLPVVIAALIAGFVVLAWRVRI